jgi:mRNA interferase MazF
MRRGEIYWADLPAPAGRRPVLLVLRDEGLQRKRKIVVAPISTQIRHLDSEVPIGIPEGLSRDSVVQCDDLQTVERSFLEARPIGRIGPMKVTMLDDAIRYALDVRCPPA